MTNLTRAKWMLGIVAAGLFVSGVTVWPAVSELKLGVRLLWGEAGLAGPPTSDLHAFLLTLIDSLETVAAEHPHILYGWDWLAFAHIVLAILFAGAMRDPVRNIWIVQCGLIMCALIPVLAAVCIPIRGIPPVWFLFDFMFAPGAAIPLWIAMRDIRRAETDANSRVASK